MRLGKSHSHSFIDLDALLVLKASLCQVNRKHACHTNQACHAPINQLSRETVKGSTTHTDAYTHLHQITKTRGTNVCIIIKPEAQI